MKTDTEIHLYITQPRYKDLVSFTIPPKN